MTGGDHDTAPARPVDWFSTIGRRGRMSFFLNFAFLNLGIGVIAGIAEGSDAPMPRLLSAACAIAGAWVNVCLTAQRLHDLDRSGWLQVVPFVVGLAGAALLALGHPLASALGIAMLLAGWVGFALWLAIAPGSPGSNRFGAPGGARAGGQS